MHSIAFSRVSTRTLLYTMWLASVVFSPTPIFAQLQAQSQPKTGKPASFDVASVKPNRSGSGSSSMSTSHGRLTASNVTARTLIQKAFHVKDIQISGGPDWLGTDKYDIAAKTERSDISDDNLWQLLQPLLADRFKLKFHRDVKQLPVYSLTLSKGGPKLKVHSGADDQPTMTSSAGSGKVKLEAMKMSMAGFADHLGRYIDRTVVNNTGLNGEYDFKLDWAQDHPGEESPSMLGALREELGLAGPSIFTAVQEQLGLRLQAAKGPVEIIFIDGAEKASAN